VNRYAIGIFSESQNRRKHQLLELAKWIGSGHLPNIVRQIEPGSQSKKHIRHLGGFAMFAAGRKLSIQRLTTRKHTILNRDYLFVEIETDGGITGIGEGSILTQTALPGSVRKLVNHEEDPHA
jgi:hypothetical protein